MKFEMCQYHNHKKKQRKLILVLQNIYEYNNTYIQYNIWILVSLVYTYNIIT